MEMVSLRPEYTPDLFRHHGRKTRSSHRPPSVGNRAISARRADRENNMGHYPRSVSSFRMWDASDWQRAIALSGMPHVRFVETKYALTFAGAATG